MIYDTSEPSCFNVIIRYDIKNVSVSDLEFAEVDVMPHVGGAPAFGTDYFPT